MAQPGNAELQPDRYLHGAYHPNGRCPNGMCAEPTIEEYLRERMAEDLQRRLWSEGLSVEPPPFVNVRKVSYVVQMSSEMAYGLIPDDRPRYVPTRRERFRWWRQERLRRARMRLASWVAGFDVEDRW